MSRKVKILVMPCLALLVLGMGIALGSVNIPLSEIVDVFLNKIFQRPLPPDLKPVSASIVWTLRFPRAFLAFFVGAALSVSGTVMQSVLRNPLASSYTLGVSSGASLMAAFVIVTGFSLPLIGSLTLPLLGFIGGLISVFLAIALALRFDRNLENNTIILIGMVLSLFINALLTLVTSLSTDRLQQLYNWQLGSFSGATWSSSAILLPVLLIGMLVLIKYGQEMDLMTFGEDQSLSAGVELKKSKFILIGISALLTGTAVSFSGVIGFVDLIAPHIMRKFYGARHRLLVPMTAFFGGIFMVVADLLARTVISPQELPVGAVTALIGAPFFAYIYFYKGRKNS